MKATQRPRVFPLSEATALPNNPTARSARVVTRETTGSTRLFAGMFWSEPGSRGGWSFGGDDPDEGRTIDGIPHLGEHDEVYLCLSGRVRVDWEDGSSDGSFEFEANDVVFFPAGHTYTTEALGDEQVRVFYVMAPTPGWMTPLGTEQVRRSRPLSMTNAVAVSGSQTSSTGTRKGQPPTASRSAA